MGSDGTSATAAAASGAGAAMGHHPFVSGGWRIEPSRCVLLRSGAEIHVEPRVMDVLVALAGRRGEAVSKEELIREVWDGRFVSDEVLTVAIFELRKALGDSARQPRFVETIPRRGYRWIPSVETGHGSTEPAARAADPVAPNATRNRRPYAVAVAAILCVAAILAISFRRPAQRASAAPPEEAAVAYRLGNHYMSQRTPQSLRRSMESFQKALQIDPAFGEAHSGYAQASVMLADGGVPEARELYLQARASAEQALALDGKLPEAHASLGMIRLFADWDFARAEQSFRRAIELNPATVSAHRAYAMLCSITGRHDMAAAEARRAVTLDPAAAARYNELAWLLYYAGGQEEALAEVAKGIEIDPSFFPLYLTKGVFLESAGDGKSGYAAMREGYSRLGTGPEIIKRLDAAFEREGIRGIYGSWLQSTLRGSPNMPKGGVWLARLYSRLGEKRQALDALERGFREREGAMVWILADPIFRPLHEDPRFQRLVDQVGLTKAVRSFSVSPQPPS